MLPPLVLSTHGIRTDAKWQKPLAEVLNDHGMRFRQHDYGKYGLHRFLNRWSNAKMVEAYYCFYQQKVLEAGNTVDLNDPAKRPSIIAHSFGTFLVGYSLLKYDDIRYDKIILCGCILPRDFDWWTLFARDQVNQVRNEYGLKDYWTKVAPFAVHNSGDSGAFGFTFRSPSLIEQRFDYFEHSDFFSKQHVTQHWVPFLKASSSNLAVRHGKGLTDEEVDCFFRATLAIDQMHYKTLPGYDEAEVSIAQGKTWFQINPDIWTFVVNRANGQPVGYINAMPVTDAAFERIKTGQLRDNQITADDIRPYVRDEHIKLYCMSIALHPTAQPRNEGLINSALEKLLNGFCFKLKNYAQHHGIIVDEMIATGWTPAGRKLCQLLGMKTAATDANGHPIFYANTKSDLDAKGYACVDNLFAIYREHQS